MQNHVSRLTAIFLAGALLMVAARGAAQVLSPVYSFDTNGFVPTPVGLLLSSNTLYGTFSAPQPGGRRGDLPLFGVFKLNTDGTGFTTLYTSTPAGSLQTNTDGAGSSAQLVLSGNRLYGTTDRGGFYGHGIVFGINTDGSRFTNLYNFGSSGTNDGADPSAGLVLSGNMLYGTTSSDGNFGGGTVFAINRDGTGYTNLYSFNYSSLGSKSSLVLSNNILYGTTFGGGSSGNGTVFALNTDGTGFTNLHSFSTLARETISEFVFFDTNSDGAYPQAGLVLSGNILYGTATKGGSGIYSDSSAFGGTVFAINTDGTGFTNLHSFNGSDGAGPIANLVLSGNTLYGTAGGGELNVGTVFGFYIDGTVFAINTDGTGFDTLHMFTPGSGTNAGGDFPVGNTFLSGSKLYGAAKDGGTNGFGTVFALNLAVAPPAIQFTANPTNGIVRLTVQFNCPAVDSGGNPILSWNWNFGDGSNSASISQNPTHTYTNAGTYLPTLSCINNNGDPVIGSGPAIITSPPPPINFTANPTNGLPPLAVQFTSPGADAGSNTLISWNWNFGDGSQSAAQNPSHTYANGGTFFPSLTCVNNNGDMLASSGPSIVVIKSILLNGGFETGTFSNWTLSGFSKDSRVTTGSTYAHSGKHGAELAAVGTMGLLSQTFSTTPGASYLISYWLESHSPITNEFQVLWNGNVLLDQTNLGDIGWTNIQLTAMAAATNSTLEFGYLTGSFPFGLDDVSVTSGGPAQLRPRIITFSVVGANIVLNGGGASPGQSFSVLMSTNLLKPISQWTPVATNSPDSSGNFNITATNAVDPKAPQRYYILELQ